MVTAELVLRRSARRSKITAAVVALLVLAGIGGGGFFALKLKKDAVAPQRAARAQAADGGAGAALSAEDLAKLMGKKAEAAPTGARHRAMRADGRPRCRPRGSGSGLRRPARRAQGLPA